MPLHHIPPYKTGQDLLAALAKPPQAKVPVVDELLYRKKVSLIAAPPGIGKSTLAAQLCLEATAGLPVFKTFYVPAPCRVLYIAFETDWEELVFSVHRLKDALPFKAENFMFDDQLLGLDITEPILPNDEVIERLKGAKPDLIVLDPFYVAVSGDLSEGKVASAAMKWLLYVAVKCNAAALLLHHPHRDKYQNGKRVDEADDTYGSRWIQANVVIHYNIKEWNEGTKWKLIKDRYKLSRKEMTLTYDPETGLSSADKTKESTRDALLKFLQSHKPGTTFTYSSLATTFGCAEGYLAHLTVQPEYRRILRKDAPPGKVVSLVRIHCDDLDGFASNHKQETNV